MPLQETSGAASYDAFGGGPAAAVKYVEDYFQTWLRTGTGASATVTTGLNASINKSLVWTKSRSAATDHKFTDTVRGATKALVSNSTAAETTDSQGLTAFSSTGYTIGTNTTYNNSGATYVDWQFVATPKFFDVVTYTGNGTSDRAISHNLGSAPGCVIAKRTDSSTDGNWYVYHIGVGSSPSNSAGYNLFLNTTNDRGALNNLVWGGVAPTSTTFTTGSIPYAPNLSGATYVAYLFAHDAGGFGASGTDNVISCGSYTGTGAAGNAVTLGYEPQWVLIKRTDSAGFNWNLQDVMRQMSLTNNFILYPNLANAEFDAGGAIVYPTATGFTLGTASTGWNASGGTYIYIAIRRGPMRTPTTGTSVYTGVLQTASSGATVTTNFPVDLNISAQPSRAAFPYTLFIDRLRGTTTASSQKLASNSTNAEPNFSSANGFGFDFNTSIKDSLWVPSYAASGNIVYWNFRRAPGFFDVVCYEGNNVLGRQITHSLGSAPEMIIVKRRNNSVSNWGVYHSGANVGTNPQNYKLILNLTDAQALDNWWNDTVPTATSFQVSSDPTVNGGSSGYVAYLFASVPGVSKVGSYTGNGSSQTINCGFTGGARFVLIKATSTTGDWLVADTARGLVSANDPRLSLNTTAAEVTTEDWLDPDNSGFIVNQVAGSSANGIGVTYVYLAIA